LNQGTEDRVQRGGPIQITLGILNACDNQQIPKRICAFLFHSLWIYTMNRCTLALRGRAFFWRALLCLDFITSMNASEAA
jgi:hypothetical protein